MRQTFGQIAFWGCQQAYIGVGKSHVREITLLSQEREHAIFGKKDRNNFETYENFEAHPVGKHMLNMPWLFEEGEYPKKASELIQANPSIEVQSDPVSAFEPVKLSTKPLLDNPVQPGLNSWQDNVDNHLKTFSELDPKPDAWYQHQSVDRAKPFTPQASTFPYNDVDQLVKPVSDRVIDNVVEPVAKKLVQSVQDKQPVETTPYSYMVESATPIRKGIGKAVVSAVEDKQPVGMAEQDLIDAAGAIKNTIGDAYSKDNYINAMNAIHYGEGLGHADDMENPDPDATRGFENSLRDFRLTGKKIQQFGNKVLDPESKYLNTNELQNWIDQEKMDLANTQAPDLIDFTKLDWKNNPDQVVQLGGKWFRQGFLGTNMFGMLTDAAKGKVHPVANQLFGTVNSIAEFHNRGDDILHSIAYGVMHGSMAESWDYMVSQLAKPMPFAPRQVLLFTNHVLGREVKEKLMNKMIEKYKAKRGFSAEEDIKKGDDYSNSQTGERDDDTLRINVCGTSTYDCEEDRE